MCDVFIINYAANIFCNNKIAKYSYGCFINQPIKYFLKIWITDIYENIPIEIGLLFGDCYLMFFAIYYMNIELLGKVI